MINEIELMPTVEALGRNALDNYVGFKPMIKLDLQPDSPVDEAASLEVIRVSQNPDEQLLQS